MAESTAFRAPDPHAGHPYAQVRATGSKNACGRPPATPERVPEAWATDRAHASPGQGAGEAARIGAEPPEPTGQTSMPDVGTAADAGTNPAAPATHAPVPAIAPRPATAADAGTAAGTGARPIAREAQAPEQANTSRPATVADTGTATDAGATPTSFRARTPGRATAPRPAGTPDAGTAAGAGTGGRRGGHAPTKQRESGRRRDKGGIAAAAGGRFEPDRSGRRWGNGWYRNGDGATHGVGAAAGSWDAIMEPRAGLPLRGANVVADARRNLLRRHG